MFAVATFNDPVCSACSSYCSYHPNQRLPGQPGGKAFRHPRGKALVHRLGHKPQMRREQHIGQPAQRVVQRQRFHVKHIERRKAGQPDGDRRCWIKGDLTFDSEAESFSVAGTQALPAAVRGDCGGTRTNCAAHSRD